MRCSSNHCFFFPLLLVPTDGLEREKRRRSGLDQGWRGRWWWWWRQRGSILFFRGGDTYFYEMSKIISTDFYGRRNIFFWNYLARYFTHEWDYHQRTAVFLWLIPRMEERRRGPIFFRGGGRGIFFQNEQNYWHTSPRNRLARYFWGSIYGQIIRFCENMCHFWAKFAEFRVNFTQIFCEEYICSISGGGFFRN